MKLLNLIAHPINKFASLLLLIIITLLLRNIHSSGAYQLVPLNQDNGSLQLMSSIVEGANGNTTTVLYVDKDAIGPVHDGTSWATAYLDLQAALVPASSDTEIWVAAGIYTPTNGLDRNATFQLKNNVALYGGFEGTETDRQNRDWQTHMTVLSGDIDDNDLNVPANNVLDIVDNNSHHLVTGSATDSTAVLDGFFVSGGKSEGAFPNPCGLQCGGGMYNDAGSPTIRNITFIGNYAEGGGAMFNGKNSHPSLTNIAFLNNDAILGGGIHNDASSPELSNVQFTNNTAFNGGGIYDTNSSSPLLTNVTFDSNSAGNYGGGLWGLGSHPILIDVTFKKNEAVSNGGGIYYSFNSILSMTNIIFDGNTSDYGGAMSIAARSDLVLFNGKFSGNDASYGGGIHNSESELTLTNVTFSGNNAAVHGAGMNHTEGHSLIQNSIFWANTSPSGSQISNDATSQPDFYSSLVQDSGGSGAGWDTALGVDGGGNIDNDPQFVRPPSPGADGKWDGIYDDYGDLRLQLGSPAINKGDNALDPDPYSSPPDSIFDITGDITGNPRIGGDRVDMGAFETPTNPLYVDIDVSAGTQNGDSWANALPDLQTALNWTITGLEIWVAEGVYIPSLVTDQSDPRTATFQLTSDAAIYGGFEGDEIVRDQRDWFNNLTTLSGDIGVQGDSDDNSYHVVTVSGVSALAVLNGFTIVEGQANGASAVPCEAQCGGGLYNDSGNPTLTNLFFRHNDAQSRGGGLFNVSGTPTLHNIEFKGNNASSGGGIAIVNSTPLLINTTFSGNSASSGGGIVIVDSNPSLINTTFSGNSAQTGGAVHSDNSNPTLTNVALSGNDASSQGGAMYNDGSNPIIQNGILWGNTALANSEIANASSQPTIKNSIIQNSGGSGINWDADLGADGGNNIDDDPQFARPPSPGLDGEWDGINDDYGDLRLRQSSPAVDAGNNNFDPDPNNSPPDSLHDIDIDLDGNGRVVNGVVDLGAYETLFYIFLPAIPHNS